MSNRPKPSVHSRDHEHGGADTIRIHWEDVGTSGSSGTGIQFGVDPQEGEYLVITTTGPTETGDIVVTSGGDLELASTDDRVDIDGGSGIGIDCHGSEGIKIRIRSTGVLYVRNALNETIFQIDQDGSLHGKTGKSLVFDL